MRRQYLVWLLSVLVVAGTIIPIYAVMASSYGGGSDYGSKPTGSTKMAATPAYTKSSVELQMAMRKLWEDHITWTRVYIIDALAGLDDAGAAADRLLKNQDDIGAAIVPYYGADAGAKLTSLLREHINLAGEVVAAAKAGNSSDLDAANKKWYANSDDIATFLSGANPNWTMKDIQDMMYTHLSLTTKEVVSRLNKDWTADIKAYDDNHDHMLMFSDMLSDGIIKQFPDKFTK